MFNPTDSQHPLTITVYAYLKGENIEKIRADIIDACNESNHRAKFLYHERPIDEIICKDLFTLLNIPEKEWHKYLEINKLLVLLNRLHQDGYGHNHLEYLLKLINKSQPEHHLRNALITGGIVLTLLSYLILTQQSIFDALKGFGQLISADIMFDWLKQTLSLSKNIPIIGIFFNACFLLWKLYDGYYYSSGNPRQKINSILFAVLSKGAAISGYAITITAAGVVTPIAGILFIFSTLIEVVESVVHYYSVLPQLTNLSTPSTWGEKADQARLKNQHQLVASSLWVKISAAIIISLAVAIWCFCPLSLPLVLSVIAIMILTNVIKHIILTHIESNHASWLQNEIKAIPADPLPSSTKKPINFFVKSRASSSNVTPHVMYGPRPGCQGLN